MPRSYRLLGIAALAAALLIAFGLGSYWTGLPYPQERYQPYQDGKTDEDGALATVTDLTAPVVKRAPCYNPQSKTESDLCAQWRAAKAAEKSADWTLYGVIASGIGITLLLWQIILTREAVKDTGDATAAMIRQNEIAETAQRPWIAVDIMPLAFNFDDGSLTIEYDVQYSNIGASVARNVNLLVNSEFVQVEEGQFKATQTRFRDNCLNNNGLDKGQSLLPGEKNKPTFSNKRLRRFVPWSGEKPNRCIYFVVSVCALYRASPNGPRLETTRHFTIGIKGDPLKERLIWENSGYGKIDVGPKNIAIHAVGASKTS